MSVATFKKMVLEHVTNLSIEVRSADHKTIVIKVTKCYKQCSILSAIQNTVSHLGGQSV
jgi:hypothetical protein